MEIKNVKIISDKIISPVIIGILQLVCFIIIFLIVRLLLGLVTNIVCKFVDIPALKNVNKALGGVFGFVKGLFIIVSIAVALNNVVQMMDFDNVITNTIENSFICDIINSIKN